MPYKLHNMTQHSVQTNNCNHKAYSIQHTYILTYCHTVSYCDVWHDAWHTVTFSKLLEGVPCHDMSVSDLWRRICNPDLGQIVPDDSCSCDSDENRPGCPASQSPSCESSESSSDTGPGSSQTESSSESEDSDSEPPIRMLSQIERRRAQTEKARKAAIEAKMKKRLTKHLVGALHIPPTNAEKYMPDLQHDSTLNKPGSYHPDPAIGHPAAIRKRRLRLIYSFFKATCAALNTLFQRGGIRHCINSSVIDDTNVRLSQTVDGAMKTARVVSVMNNVQGCMVTFEKQQQEGQESGTDLGHTCFQLQTPMVVLPRATASTIVAELCGWFLCALGLGGAVGSRWQILGVQESLFAGIPIQGQALCFDSLSTNIKICKLLRTELYKEEGKKQQKTLLPHFWGWLAPYTNWPWAARLFFSSSLAFGLPLSGLATCSSHRTSAVNSDQLCLEFWQMLSALYRSTSYPPVMRNSTQREAKQLTSSPWILSTTPRGCLGTLLCPSWTMVIATAWRWPTGAPGHVVQARPIACWWYWSITTCCLLWDSPCLWLTDGSTHPQRLHSVKTLGAFLWGYFRTIGLQEWQWH